MPKIKLGVNLDDVKSGFDPLPDGDYYIRIMKYDTKKGKETEYPNLLWHCEVFGHDNADMNGKSFLFNTSLDPKALFKLKGFLEKAGIPWDKAGFDPDDAIGKEVGITVSTREYEGEPRNEVKKFFAR